MIERLELRNFQAHSRLRLALSPGVTSIVGETDAGKSSLLRALRWLSLNQPQGDEFLRWGETDCRVRILVDGVWVGRRRGPSGNLYLLDGETYRSFGAGVPQPIAELLRLSPVNFQRQLDPAYWFHLSGSQLAKELNELIDLDVIDTSQQRAAAMVRQARSRQDVCRERLTAAKFEEARLRAAAQMYHRWQALEEEQDRIAQDRTKHARKTALVRSGRESALFRDRVRKPLKMGVAVEAAGAAYLKAKERTDRLRELIAKGRKLNRITLIQAPNLPVWDAGPVVRLQELVATGRDLKREVDRCVSDLCSAEKELAKVKSCPLCGQSLRSSAPTST